MLKMTGICLVDLSLGHANLEIFSHSLCAHTEEDPRLPGGRGVTSLIGSLG